MHPQNLMQKFFARIPQDLAGDINKPSMSKDSTPSDGISEEVYPAHPKKLPERG